MEKRIKLIAILTIAASLAVVAAQFHWLYSQYLYLLRQLENDLYEKTLSVAEADRKLRDGLKDRNLHVISRAGIKHGRSAPSGPGAGWSFEIYIINSENAAAPAGARYDSLYIDSLYKAGREIKKYQFDIEPSGRKHDVYDALDRFIVNEKCPFTVERLDSLLLARGLSPAMIRIETADTAVWEPGRINHTSVFRPVLEVTCPLDMFRRQQFRVSYQLDARVVSEGMLLSFITSAVLSLLLIFCLAYQISTIFRQQRMDELRKSFVYTMVHELKRPVTALKLCISFMKNDKMMQDAGMKKEILRNSYNELDNLSSYFSKLRDVMADSPDDIPLNLSVFNLKELVEQCIEKQIFPAGREIGVTVDFENDAFEITADKMHIANILCNLLENAVKYSEGQTEIRIHCRSLGDTCRLEVSDNGYGISETECRYVFDRFFRSANVAGKHIPGIGLGLFYVRLLVRAHKGDISLRSVLGKGSTFIIEIPEKP
jgi:two-component system phosphate regulon sensor histidine kinase PhoR